MDNNLSDSKRKLLAAMRREMEEVAAPIMAEIQKLRDEQRERHEASVRQRAAQNNQIKRHIHGILAALGLGLTEKDR